MRGLSGKIAFVTGGASGIGAATAKRLAEEGTRVAVADIDFEGAQLVAKEIEGIAVPFDVTRPDSVTAAFAAAVDVTGSIDILVNNAGGDRAAMFVDTDAASWDRAINLNLKGTIACTHAAFPSMIDRRAGSIVDVSSEAGPPGRMTRRPLRGDQSRRARLHQGDRSRGRGLRHPLQCGRSRPDRHAHAR